jgi:biopolymer transport protein ExbD
MRKKFRPQIEEESVEEPLINLTPLIDVVFVVLIAFMLIAPILDTDSIDLAQSGGLEKKELQTGPISITIQKDNTIWMQGVKVNLTQMEANLKQEKKRHPQAVPQVLLDKQAHFGTYQSVKNSLESIGFAQMDVILKPG